MFIYVVLYLFGSTAAVEFSKTEQGVSGGFLGNCLGSLQPVVFKPKTLEKLTMSLFSQGNVLMANWTKYSYSRVSKLAKHHEMDFKKQTVLIVPGYLDSINFPVGRALGSVYKELGYNVIVLDHFKLTTEHFPYSPTRHTAEMLANLTARGLDPIRLDLVGISLGAQAILSSLTAIDPSGPCFRYLGPEHRIDPSDADFILQITTSMDGFGISTKVGQVAMLVNGGEYATRLQSEFLRDKK